MLGMLASLLIWPLTAADQVLTNRPESTVWPSPPRDRAQTRLTNHRRAHRRMRLDPARRHAPPGQPAASSITADLTGCHDAHITQDPMIDDTNGDKLDIGLVIWAAFANASLAGVG
jgi:hypothetical protein